MASKYFSVFVIATLLLFSSAITSSENITNVTQSAQNTTVKSLPAVTQSTLQVEKICDMTRQFLEDGMRGNATLFYEMFRRHSVSTIPIDISVIRRLNITCKGSERVNSSCILLNLNVTSKMCYLSNCTANETKYCQALQTGFSTKPLTLTTQRHYVSSAENTKGLSSDEKSFWNTTWFYCAIAFVGISSLGIVVGVIMAIITYIENKMKPTKEKLAGTEDQKANHLKTNTRALLRDGTISDDSDASYANAIEEMSPEKHGEASTYLQMTSSGRVKAKGRNHSKCEATSEIFHEKESANSQSKAEPQKTDSGKAVTASEKVGTTGQSQDSSAKPQETEKASKDTVLQDTQATPSTLNEGETVPARKNHPHKMTTSPPPPPAQPQYPAPVYPSAPGAEGAVSLDDALEALGKELEAPGLNEVAETNINTDNETNAKLEKRNKPEVKKRTAPKEAKEITKRMSTQYKGDIDMKVWEMEMKKITQDMDAIQAWASELINKPEADQF